MNVSVDRATHLTPTDGALDIEGMVRHFHESVRLERRLGCADSISEQMAKWAEELMTLRSAYDVVHQKRSTVGTMPPTPHTARARAGAVLVRIIQRMLFWYTPQITSYHEAVARTLNHVCASAEAQLATARYLSAEIAELRREMSSLSVRQSPAPAIAPPPDEALPEAFYTAFQEQFRGPEQDVEANLQQYLRILDECKVDPSGTWLDIGCGRGEWLQCAAGAGHRALGVDSSAAAVAHCRERGLAAETGDALEFLAGQSKHSASVITAFHVLEHWPVATSLRFISDAVRVLRPGGVLIIEMPNPENLRMGARDFWLDPTHRRPIPPQVMEFMFRYCGVTIRRRLDLHPVPERELFPCADHEVVQRLNQYFHGPQAFALIGRPAG